MKPKTAIIAACTVGAILCLPPAVLWDAHAIWQLQDETAYRAQAAETARAARAQAAETARAARAQAARDQVIDACAKAAKHTYDAGPHTDDAASAYYRARTACGKPVEYWEHL
jgi:hypothetical protein